MTRRVAAAVILAFAPSSVCAQTAPLLADRRNGTELAQRLGPYCIVVAGEKRAARWVRNVTTIDLEPVP